MNKKKIIIIALCTVLVFILVRACTNGLTNKIRDDIENETTINNRSKSNNEYVEKYKDDWETLIDYFLMERIEYDEMPLSEKFKKKYPSLDSFIQGKCTGISIDSIFDEYDKNSNIMTVTYKTGNGFEEIGYKLHYIINQNNELDDIEILESRLYRYDTDGYPVYTFYKTYDRSPRAAIGCLTNPRRYMNEDTMRFSSSVPYLTDNYIKNHKDYKTESIIPWKDWLYIDEGTVKQDENNDRIWYVEAVNTEEIRKYKIEFIIDERGYVDDYILEEIERREVVDKEEVLDIFNELYG